MNYPKIGIRPTIDGRWGGIREGLESQTMGMANAAKELIETNLRYPDGTPVQCIISDTTIGGGAEAAKCARQFSTENVVATLSVTPCWCYGSETFDMDPIPLKRCGDLTVQNVPEQSIWQQLWLLLRKKDFPLSPFTATMFRILQIRPYHQMLLKRFYALQKPRWL